MAGRKDYEERKERYQELAEKAREYFNKSWQK